MAKFNFNLRNGKDSASAIHLVIRWNNNRIVYPTGESINPKFWEDDIKKRNFQRAKETKQFNEYPEFNARLDKILQIAKDVFRRFQNDNENKTPSIEQLRKLIYKNLREGVVENKEDIFSFITRFMNEVAIKNNNKTGKMFSKLTIAGYNNTFNILKEYKKHKRTRIDFDVIDLDFYHDFTDYLIKIKGFATNTIGKQIKNIKVFMNEATERGINTNLAYQSKRFQVKTEETDSIYLTENELIDLYSLDLKNNKRLEKVRDLFLVGCWTGLRFSDFSNIKKDNIKGNFIEITTKKTAETVIIPIHSTVKEIMEKYKHDYQNSLPPAISNVKMNQYIKEVCKLAKSLNIATSTSKTKGGFHVSTSFQKHELVTTHTARRSFASNLYIDGVPSITIMKITGHRTEKAFMRYIKITPNENAKILQLHWQTQSQLYSV